MTASKTTAPRARRKRTKRGPPKPARTPRRSTAIKPVETSEVCNVRSLVLLEQQWAQWFYRLHFDPERSDGPPAARVLAVTRLMRAAWIAFATEDDAALTELSSGAASYLVGKSWIVQDEPQLVDMRRYDLPWRFDIADVAPEKGQLGTRAHLVRISISTLAHFLEKSGPDPSVHARSLADIFLAPAISPSGFASFFLERGVPIPSPVDRGGYRAALDRVAARFEEILRDRRTATRAAREAVAETLFRHGMRAIGVSEDAVKSLLSFEAKAGKRGCKA